MTKINFIQSTLIWAAGYDRRTAKECTSSEITKMCVAGTMVMLPALLGFFSYGYAFWILGKGSTEAALLGGSVAAVVLFVIDRSIMAYGRPGVFSLGMAGRVLLAVTVSFLLAEPVLLWAFDDAIREQQVDELATAKRNAVVPFETQIDATRHELDPYEVRLQELQQAYTEEMDGTGGSRQVGLKQNYRRKRADFIAYKKERDDKVAQINTRIAQIEIEKAARVAEVVATNANGLLGRMRALHALGQSDPFVWWATWLIRAALVLIELLPLMLKLSKSGDKGLYYQLVDKFDTERETVVEGQSQHRVALQVKEGEFKYQTEFARVVSKEIAMMMGAKTSDTNYFMGRVMAMAETKINHKQRAAKRFVNEEALLEQVYRDIDAIYEEFLRTVYVLLDRRSSSPSPENA